MRAIFSAILSVRGFGLSIAAIALWGSCNQPGVAAEAINIRLGRLQTTITLAELEEFGKTGELSPALQPYRRALTPQVRYLLHSRLPIDPEIGDRILGNILQSPLSLEIYQNLAPIFPHSRLDYLQTAVSTALSDGNFTVLSILEAYPGKTIAVNATAALSFALQFNGDYWRSRILEPLLMSQERRETAEIEELPPTVVPTAIDPSQPGYERVQKTTLMLQDGKRERSIPVDLYWSNYSVSSGPLVIISHGFGSDRFYFAYLASHLASYGLTVAAIEHPGSNVNWLIQESTVKQMATLVPPEEFINRPQDISFLLDRLAEVNNNAGPLQGKLNTNRVSLIGHSLGGYTAFALAGARLDLASLRQFCRDRPALGRSPADWLQCAAADLPVTPQSLQDERIVQAIVISPLVGRLFGKNGITGVKIPTLILANTNDAVTPALEHQIRPFAQLQGSKYLLAAIGAPHLSVGNRKSPHPASPQFVPLKQVLQGLSLAFIKQLTSEKDRYRDFLSPAYTQSFSTEQLPLHFYQSSLQHWWKPIDLRRLLPSFLSPQTRKKPML
ncbi:alpha/beta hydrolase [Roseofilum casamattae]|uniref:Alpha/beta hydrolase n=1 Tax=Roseofilum casamattae BLCC-M143 TaxID=3022442 RepID=A0ABT7BVA5_9CYAN|nr:alpha/beta hydrolase [Roseofilum casamattae]MDJ1183119.1 alpha/beta hydrolase [Roseofilum casamattae BLCC-M143]